MRYFLWKPSKFAQGEGCNRTSDKKQLDIANQKLSGALAQLQTSQQALDTAYGKLRDAGASYVED